MSEKRLSNEAREKQLRLAISRIQRNRPRTKQTKLTIAAVAREAGVSTALIHNNFPEIAELVREAQGRSSRAQRDTKHQSLKEEREKNVALRAEVDSLKAQAAKLASINETLSLENADLKSRVSVINIANHRKP